MRMNQRPSTCSHTTVTHAAHFDFHNGPRTRRRRVHAMSRSRARCGRFCFRLRHGVRTETGRWRNGTIRVLTARLAALSRRLVIRRIRMLAFLFGAAAVVAARRFGFRQFLQVFERKTGRFARGRCELLAKTNPQWHRVRCGHGSHGRGGEWSIRRLRR